MKNSLSLKIMGAALAIFTIAATAQTASFYGALSNFDAVNNTGRETYGFEIEIDGIVPSDITYMFGAPYIRYGSPQVVPFVNGVYLRYTSPWDAANQRFTQATPAAVNFAPTNGHMCFNAFPNYLTAGCEHFGVGLTRNATNVVYRWLVNDPNNAGVLIPLDPPVSLPAPAWTVIPPAQVNAAPVIVAEVQAPPPPPAEQFGEAQWMKVYKTEQPRQVGLEELLSDNPVVPQDPAHLETSWYLLQSRIGANGKRQQKRNQGALGGGSHSVVRRYEHYKYTGAYDPLTHEALCADGVCNAPADAELGDYIGAQMVALNLNVPPVLTVSTTGNGAVTSSSGGIKCPSACSASFAAGTSVTLTAAPAGTSFAGWSGACTGTQLTCTVTMNDAASVTATFLPIYTLSVGRSGSGVVTGTPADINSALINCGGTCSAKFAQGAVVTLTATPAAGVQFVKWGNSCSGTAPTCTLTINKNTSVQATFK